MTVTIERETTTADATIDFADDVLEPLIHRVHCPNRYHDRDLLT